MIPKAVSMDLRQITTLLIFFIFYVVLGGVVFMHIEAPHEVIQKRELNEATISFKENLKALKLPTPQADNLTRIINAFLVSQSVTALDEAPHERLSTQWDFFNSFFFAITVVTTIGYGHLSPSTPMGRMFCLVYALFGIPMTGILLGAIGDRFSRCFLDEIHRVRRRHMKPFGIKLIVIKRGLFFFLPWFIVFLVTPALVFYYLEEWSFEESFYYCFITLSTIGFGDLVAGQFDGEYVWFYKIVVVLWIIFGLAYLSMILNFISQGLRSHRLTHVVHSIPHSIRRISTGPNSHSMKHHGLRNQRHKMDMNKNSTLSLPYNGKAVSECSTPGGSVSPTPSPSIHVYSDTSSSGSVASRNTQRTFMRRLCRAFNKGSKKKQMSIASAEVKHNECNQLIISSTAAADEQQQIKVPNREIRIVVTNEVDNRNSLSSGVTTMSTCESPLPLTRADLVNSRKVFFQNFQNFQNLDSDQVSPVTAV